ncbi:MAG: type II toxin-antitoxin system VapC family toxin [Thermoprotei archaeon]|nr:MAG: type II toxin-antitoxin system VapC family toxin [Thermoprotei archaeon]
MVKYFADTYALIEILRGSPAYQRYALEELTTTMFNLLELAYALIKDFEPSQALNILTQVQEHVQVIEPSIEDLVNASKLRLKARQEGRNLSLINCLGYVIAKRLDIKFLTGDREFKGLENVEFVK